MNHREEVNIVQNKAILRYIFFNYIGPVPTGVNGRVSIYRIHRAEVNILQSKVMWRFKGTVPVGLYRTTNTYRFSRAGQCYTKYGYAWVNILYK